MIRDRLIEAYLVAKDSPDLSTQNGAVVYRGNQRLLAQFNTVPIPMQPEYQERPLKYSYFDHAEKGCVHKAARHGIALNGSVMYCPYACCDYCAIAVVTSGIREVVRHKPIMDAAPERWKSIIEIGDNILRRGGVIITEFEDRLDVGFEIRFDGKPWRP